MFALNSGDCLGLSDMEHTVQVAFTTVYTCMVHSIWFIVLGKAATSFLSLCFSCGLHFYEKTGWGQL